MKREKNNTEETNFVSLSHVKKSEVGWIERY